jgi:GTP-binding protein HflX
LKALEVSSPEKALLIGVEVKGRRNAWPVESSLRELFHLVYTANIEVLGDITQRIDKFSPTYCIGSGKLEELIALKDKVRADIVIFNNNLSPLQQRNLEQALDIKVIDRTTLILDIFAQRAHTKEGKLQVELAQYQYLLPRLRGRWAHLERLGGGIGTRGPGESQLETDRRLVQKRIRHLKSEVEEIRKHRSLYRRKRKQMNITTLALIGYTNAGKSTLLNLLSQAGVLVEDKLFATLDPTTRRLILPEGQVILLTDTVGFIHDLPHHLVDAFRATLEELSDADLLLHVVDISHPEVMKQYIAVEKVLTQLHLEAKPKIVVLNKIDLFSSLDGNERVKYFLDQINDGRQRIAFISAERGWGKEELVRAISIMLNPSLIMLT